MVVSTVGARPLCAGVTVTDGGGVAPSHLYLSVSSFTSVAVFISGFLVVARIRETVDTNQISITLRPSSPVGVRIPNRS